MRWQFRTCRRTLCGLSAIDNSPCGCALCVRVCAWQTRRHGGLNNPLSTSLYRDEGSRDYVSDSPGHTLIISADGNEKEPTTQSADHAQRCLEQAVRGIDPHRQLREG